MTVAVSLHTDVTQEFFFKHRQPGECSAMTFSKVLDMLVWLAYLILRGGSVRLRAEPSHFISVVGSGAEERRTPAEIQPRSRRS